MESKKIKFLLAKGRKSIDKKEYPYRFPANLAFPAPPAILGSQIVATRLKTRGAHC